MRSPKRLTWFQKLLIRVLCVILTLSIGIFCLFEYKARELVHNLIGNELEICGMNAIDEAVCEVLDEVSVMYSDLVNITLSEDGNVSNLSADTLSINKLKSDLSLRITDKIRKDKKATVGIPAGAFTGLVLLSQTGPPIYVTLTFGGSVITTMRSEFASAGINQTIHRIYLIVRADISLTNPIIDYSTQFETEYELCNTVIVGAIPQFYGSVR